MYLRRAPVSTEFPRGSRGVAATRLRETSTWQPRRRRDPSPRNIHVAAAASPRPVSAKHPRGSRGVAATRPSRAASCVKHSSPNLFTQSGPMVCAAANAASGRSVRILGSGRVPAAVRVGSQGPLGVWVAFWGARRSRRRVVASRAITRATALLYGGRPAPPHLWFLGSLSSKPPCFWDAKRRIGCGDASAQETRSSMYAFEHALSPRSHAASCAAKRSHASAQGR